MKHAILASLSLVLAAGASSADTITQTVNFDYDPLQGTTFPVIQGFDSQGGTRWLKEVTFEFRHNFSLDVFLESTGPTPLTMGDYSVNLSYISIFQLGLAGDDNNPPFFGPGAFFVDNFSGDLAAYDGVPGNDGPDSLVETFTDAYTHTQSYGVGDQHVREALTDVGELTTVYGGFGELFFYWINEPGWPTPDGGIPNYPDDAALWVALQNFRHWGEIVITYEYGPIPAPTTAAPLAAFLLAARRRR